MGMRTPLGYVRGLGSTNDGVKHWWMQRLTGIALIPLTLWFLYSAVQLSGATHAEFITWVGTYGNPVLLSVLIVCMFHHGQLGLQVIIEDYISSEGIKIFMLIAIKFTAIIFSASAIFAILRLTIKGF
jgi:succinate dehydrogenase / fumarate reductase membrane anchor subunit